MKSLIYYLIQVTVASGILYGYYHFFLRNKKFHHYNRFYLLAIVVVSILVPFLAIPVYFSDAAPAPAVLYSLNLISTENAAPGLQAPGVVATQSGITMNWKLFAWGLYFLLSFLVLLRMIFSLGKIRRIIRTHAIERLDDINFVNTNEPGTPFSFFRWLFWNQNIELRSEKGEQVFRHELFHIRQKHSWDIVFLELITVAMWINPFFHFIKKELKAIHEFLADEFAVKENDQWKYAELLLMQVLNTHNQLINPFFNNQIKRRIAMITSSQKTSYQYLRKIMVLPIAAIVLALFAFTYNSKKETKKIIDSIKNNVAATDTTQPKSYFYFDEKTRAFAGSYKGQKVERTVFNESTNDVTLVFTSKEAIKISNKEAQSLGLFAEDLNGQAIKANNKGYKIFVVNNQDHEIIAVAYKDKPVSVFHFNKPDTITQKKWESIYGLIPPPPPPPQPSSIINAKKFQDALIIVDGKEMDAKAIENIPVNSIKTINILKGETARKKYGEKGRNGVVEITTNNKALLHEEITIENTEEGISKDEAQRLLQQAFHFLKNSDFESFIKLWYLDNTGNFYDNTIFGRQQVEQEFYELKDFLSAPLEKELSFDRIEIQEMNPFFKAKYKIKAWFDFNDTVSKGFGFLVDYINDRWRFRWHGETSVWDKNDIAANLSPFETYDYSKLDFNEPSVKKRWHEMILEIKSIALKEGKAAYEYKGRTYVFGSIINPDPKVARFAEQNGTGHVFILNGELISSVAALNKLIKRSDVKNFGFIHPEEALQKYKRNEAIVYIETDSGHFTKK